MSKTTQMQKSAMGGVDQTLSSMMKSPSGDGQEAPAVDPTLNYKCLRKPEDGSIYYGEVAYVRKSSGELIKFPSPIYETEIKALPEEQRLEQFQMVRHGYGLYLFSGQRNEDGVMTKYEGAWNRDKKHGQGFAVYADGSTYRGKFSRDVKDGQGTFTWTKGHEYRGSFRDGQMDGQGLFMHSSGMQHSGTFKRNQF